MGLIGLVALAASPASSGAGAVAGLTIKPTHGSAIHFEGEPIVSCDAWEPGIPRKTLHIELRNPDRGWELRAVVADVRGGQKIRIPTDVLSDHPEGALFFVYRLHPLIEASTNEEEGSGWLSFSQVSCTPGEPVTFTIHARLGSELSAGTEVRVDGTFTGPVQIRPRS